MSLDTLKVIRPNIWGFYSELKYKYITNETLLTSLLLVGSCWFCWILQHSHRHNKTSVRSPPPRLTFGGGGVGGALCEEKRAGSSPCGGLVGKGHACSLFLLETWAETEGRTARGVPSWGRGLAGILPPPPGPSWGRCDAGERCPAGVRGVRRGARGRGVGRGIGGLKVRRKGRWGTGSRSGRARARTGGRRARRGLGRGWRGLHPWRRRVEPAACCPAPAAARGGTRPDCGPSRPGRRVEPAA